MPLSDTACRNAKLTEKPRKLADADGMYLLVNKSGKYWRWDFRFATKRKTMALGVYPEVSLLQARERLQRNRAVLASGIDPMAHRAITKNSSDQGAVTTFELLAREWLLHQAGRWEPITLQRALASLEANIFPALGQMPAAAITPRQVMDVIKTIEMRGAAEIASRVLQRIKSVYRYGVTHQHISSNPMVDLVPADILKPRRVNHRPALSASELPHFIRKLDEYAGNAQTSNGFGERDRVAFGRHLEGSELAHRPALGGKAP